MKTPSSSSNPQVHGTFPIKPGLSKAGACCILSIMFFLATGRIFGQATLDSIPFLPINFYFGDPPILSCAWDTSSAAGCQAGESSTEITIPEYAPCPFTVEYFWFHCPGQELRFQIKRIAIVMTNDGHIPVPQCAAFGAEYNAALANGTLSQFYNTLQDKAFKELSLTLVRNTVERSIANGDPIPPGMLCSGVGYIVFQNQVGVCQAQRTYPLSSFNPFDGSHYTASPPFGGPNVILDGHGMVIEYWPCTTTCCKHQVRVCYDPETGLYTQTEIGTVNMTSYPGNCLNIAPLLTPIDTYVGEIWTDCTSACLVNSN